MNLNKFIERNATSDFKSRKLYERFYSELYFRTTDELKTARSVLNSKMVKSNTTTIILSLVAFLTTIYITVFNLLKDFFKNTTELMLILSVIMLAIYFLYLSIDSKESMKTKRYRALVLLTEAIDNILSERNEKK